MWMRIIQFTKIRQQTIKYFERNAVKAIKAWSLPEFNNVFLHFAISWSEKRGIQRWRNRRCSELLLLDALDGLELSSSWFLCSKTRAASSQGHPWWMWLHFKSKKDGGLSVTGNNAFDGGTFWSLRIVHVSEVLFSQMPFSRFSCAVDKC